MDALVPAVEPPQKVAAGHKQCFDNGSERYVSRQSGFTELF